MYIFEAKRNNFTWIFQRNFVSQLFGSTIIKLLPITQLRQVLKALKKKNVYPTATNRKSFVKKINVQYVVIRIVVASLSCMSSFFHRERKPENNFVVFH